eukprot:EG_transcript_4569
MEQRPQKEKKKKRKADGGHAPEPSLTAAEPSATPRRKKPKRDRGAGAAPDSAAAAPPAAEDTAATGGGPKKKKSKDLPASVEEAKTHAEETALFFQNFQTFFDTHPFSSDAERVECLESAHSHLLALLDGHSDLLNHKVIGAGVDHLIQHSTLQQIRRLFHKLAGGYSRLMCGGGTSRVMELLFNAALSAHASVLEAEDEEGAPSLSRILSAVADEVSADVPTLLCHRFGSFALRTFIRVLAGLPAADTPAAEVTDRPVFIRELTAVSVRVIDTVADRVVEACQDVPTSACLQVVIEVLARLRSRAHEYESNPQFEGLLATYDSLCRTIFAQFEALVQQSATSRVVEALVAHTGAEGLADLYTQHLAPRVEYMLQCPNLGAAYVLQSALRAVTLPSHLAVVLDSLPEDGLLHALNTKKFGVINHLLQATHRIGAHQSAAVARVTAAMRRFLACGPAAPLSPLLLGHGAFRTAKAHFGHTLLQQLLAQGPAHAKDWYRDFRDNIDIPAMVELASSPTGSRVLEAYVQGTDAKSAEALGSALQGRYGQLARDVNGSYTLEKLFHRCPLEVRKQIATELVEAYSELRRIPQSLMVLKRCNIDQFRSRPEEWERLQRQAARKEEFMARIVGAVDRVRQRGHTRF